MLSFSCFLEKPIVAYVHDLSEIRTSQRNNAYFELKLQTPKKTYRTVCFSLEKHSTCKANFESSSPVKISKYQIKTNRVTQEDEIHMNERTKFEEPDEEEIDFDIKHEEKPEVDATPFRVEDLLQWETNTLVNTSGRITFTGSEETIQAKGKTLTKRKTALTDNTGTIRLVLWDGDIGKVTSGSAYELSKVAVKRFQEKKYVTLNTKSSITPIDLNVEREDEVIVQSNLNFVTSPADGVQSLCRYLSCNKCNTKIVPMAGKNIVKCSECGMAQLKAKSLQRMYASVLFTVEDEQINLLLFDDKLTKLCSIHKQLNGGNAEDEISKLSDDDIMEVIPTVRAKIYGD